MEDDKERSWVWLSRRFTDWQSCPNEPVLRLRMCEWWRLYKFGKIARMNDCAADVGKATRGTNEIAEGTSQRRLARQVIVHVKFADWRCQKDESATPWIDHPWLTSVSARMSIVSDRLGYAEMLHVSHERYFLWGFYGPSIMEAKNREAFIQGHPHGYDTLGDETTAKSLLQIVESSVLSSADITIKPHPGYLPFIMLPFLLFVAIKKRRTYQ